MTANPTPTNSANNTASHHPFVPRRTDIAPEPDEPDPEPEPPVGELGVPPITVAEGDWVTLRLFFVEVSNEDMGR